LIVYFDTSAFVPLLRDEPTTEQAERLWADAELAVSSRLLYVEARAAVARVHRQERLDRGEQRRAVARLDQLVGDVVLVEITDPVVRRAADLAEALALRGYDAVHLGSAELLADPELVFASGDKKLLQAALDLGVTTAKLN
jgi:uncharacterized protein